MYRTKLKKFRDKIIVLKIFMRKQQMKFPCSKFPKVNPNRQTSKHNTQRKE